MTEAKKVKAKRKPRPRKDKAAPVAHPTVRVNVTLRDILNSKGFDSLLPSDFQNATYKGAIPSNSARAL